MTAIAIWHNHEVPNNPCLWIAADSRVNTNQSTLIDDGAKIFPFQVICRSPDSQGFFSNAYYAHTFGYCFAGSTLMGQNTYLALTPLLSNLISQTGYIPSLSDIAQHILAYLRLTFDDFKLRVGQRAIFEAAIFGYCHRTQRLSTYHFSPKLENGIVQMMVAEHSHMKGNDFIYLGDNQTNMTAAITTAFSSDTIPGRPLSRIPRYVIQDHIDDESCTTIGGDIQLGTADQLGFHPFMLCKPRIKGQGEAYFSYLGREITPELRFVGEAMVGTNAMI
jgi:hypothetical protein